MIGPILKEAVVLIVFCHIFVSGKDLLEIYQPNPSLPQELNEWLVSVQKHKNDFRLIREVAARGQHKNPYPQFDYDDDEGVVKKNANQLNLEDDIEEQKVEQTEETPKNDIYPYMYKSEGDFENNRKNSYKKGSHRLRRASDEVGFMEHKSLVNLEPKSQFGEIKRVDEKYPERYKESFSEEHNKMKSNFKEKKEASDLDKDVSKREVQIEIKKDGKLLKQINEDEAHPKSIILNIENRKENIFPPQDQLENAKQISEGTSNLAGKQNSQIAPNTNIAPERSLNADTKQIKSKEFSSNFNNLFSANEHLNTDSSIARQTGTALGPLVYHVTIPNFMGFSELSSSYTPHPGIHTPSRYEENSIPMPLLPDINLNTDIQPLSNPYSYNHNNLQDMSKYWTVSEKNQMQKGIDFARNNENLRKFVQHIKYPQKMQGQGDNETGFEPATRIEVDNGQLVKINVAEKINEGRATEKTADALNYMKRNGPVQTMNREGIIEIDSQKPNLIRTKQTENRMLVMSNVVPNSFVKGNSKNTLVDHPNAEVMGAIKSTPDLTGKFENVGNVENKNRLPNIRDMVKPENKRQLEYLRGKIRLLGSDRNLDENWNEAPLLLEQDTRLNADAFVEIPKAVTSDFNLHLKVPDAESPKFENQMLEGINNDQIINGDHSDKILGMYKKVLPVEENIEPINENFLGLGLEENIPKCNNPGTNLEENHFDSRNNINTAHIPNVHIQLDQDRFATEKIPNLDSSALEIDDIPIRLSEDKIFPRIDNFQNYEKRFRYDAHNPMLEHNNFRRNPYKYRSNRYTERYDPDLKKFVLVYNNPPYAVVRRKKDEYGHYVSNVAEEMADNANKDDLSKWSNDEDLADYRRENGHNLSPSLTIRKRDDSENPRLVRKRHKKRHHDSGYLGNLVASSINLKTVGDADTTDRSASKFVGRQLKAMEYVYDAYDKEGDDYYDQVSTEIQEAPDNVGRVELLQKDSVEGDYGDEEDSVTEKQKKVQFSAVKKTDNEYANPRTTTENEDYDYSDDYDNTSNCGNEKPAEPETHGEEATTEKAKHVNINRPPAELTESDISSVHHGSMSGNKFKSKLTRKHARLIPVSASKIKIDDDEDRKSVRDEKVKTEVVSRKPARKALRHRRNRNKHPAKSSADKMSDFQHWPTFVIEDQETEENLKKRSATDKKKSKNYDFPMSSKDFFVKSKKKRKVNDPKMDKPSGRAEDSAPEVPVQLEKRETESPVGHRSNVRAPGQIPVTNVCEIDENFNKSTVELTTMLVIDPPPEGKDNDTSHCIYEKIDDILDGHFPSKVVSDIFDEIRSNSRLSRRFNRGLKRSNKNFCFQNLNDTNTEETRKILDSMTYLMNRLQLTATCQVLPHNIRAYLKTISRTRKQDSLAHMKQMKEVNFDESQNQKNFIFESSPQAGNNFQDKAKMLMDLLDKFNNLPNRCKTRGQPVKEYIENHLGMLNNMMDAGQTPTQNQSCAAKNIQSRSNDVPKKSDEDALVQEQLDSLGLGKERRFTPKFDLEKILDSGRREKSATTASDPQAKGHQQNANVNKRDLNSVSRSKKYNKLLDAVRKVKLKRDAARRLAEAFGRSSDYSGFNFNSKSVDTREVAKASFESPLVYSL